MDFKIKIR